MHMIVTCEKQCWGFKVVGETPTKKAGKEDSMHDDVYYRHGACTDT